MAVDQNETRRQRILDALASGATRSWSVNSSGTQTTYTVGNVQIRTLNDTQVLSLDIVVTRDGVAWFADRINMPNPATAVRNNSGTPQDNPLAATRATLQQIVATITQNFTVVHDMRDGSGGFIGDTLAVRSSTADGKITSTNATWNTALDGSGLAVDTTGTLEAVASTGFTVKYSYVDFDTSSLGAGATITGAIFTFYGNGTAEANANTTTIEVRSFNWGGTLTTADWIDANPSTGWTNLTRAANKTLGSWGQTNNQQNDFTDDGNYSTISQTGVSYFAVGLARVGVGTPSGANTWVTYSADNAGTTSDPLLTVTYTAPVNITINSVTATATAAGNAPVPTILMNPPAATATAAADAPTISTTGATTTVSSVTATATATANAPVPTVAPDSVTATATAAADAPVPTVAPNSVTATATASANAPGMTRSIGSATATSTAAANAPTPTVSIPSARAQATATANAPGMTRSIGSVTAAATATANAPTPSVVVSILSDTATATATALAPFITYTVWPLKVATAIGKKFAAALGLKKKHQATVAIDQTYAVAMAPALKHAAALAINQTYRVEITMSSLTVYNGNSVIVTATFTTVASGAVADPDAIVFKVKDEHNNVTSYTYGTDSEVAKSSTGIYTCTYTPDADGEWITQATGTGAVAAVGQERLTVLPVI